jgi:uncharacterized membrane protein (UPF0127 family)
VRTRIAAAAVVAVCALVGLVLLVTRVHSGENGTGGLPFTSTTAAAVPFDAFSEARVAVGMKCLRVLVASTPDQRTQGLRGVTALGPYAGMLFVNAVDTNARYTMAGTPMPLAITFFDAHGKPVDGTDMTPCPNGSDATCPEYASAKRYRYALERPANASPSAPGPGSLGACAA